MADTVAARVYLIRLALGDGFRTPMPMQDFADILSAAGEKVYRSPQVSDIENGKRRLALEEVSLFAAVDPLNRGRAWLAFGDEPDAGASRVPSYVPEAPAPESGADLVARVKRERAAAKKRGRQA